MNELYFAWKRFEQSGFIADYLAYCQIKQTYFAKTEGETDCADFHGRRHFESESDRQ